MYRGWPPTRGEYPPQHSGRGPPSQAAHTGQGQLDTRSPFREDRGSHLPPVHHDYHHHGPPDPHAGHGQLDTRPPFREDRCLPLSPLHRVYRHRGSPDPYRPSPPRRRNPSPGPDPYRPSPPRRRFPSPGPGSDRVPGDDYWGSRPLKDLRMRSPSPPRGGTPQGHSLVITASKERTPPETAPPLNPIPYNRDYAPRHVYEGTDGCGPSRQSPSTGGSCSTGNPDLNPWRSTARRPSPSTSPGNPKPGRSTARPPSPSTSPDPDWAGSHEGQIGVKQKPEQIEVFIGPQKTKLPYEKRDCTLAVLKEDHVLLNLLTDILSQKKRVFDEVKEEKKESALAKVKWKPVNTEVPFPETDVLEDISKERHEGTVLEAILKTPQKPQSEGQPPEMGRLLMTVAGEQKQLTFTAADIQTTATMLDGDKVKFNISTHRETKEERAVNLDILPDTFDKSTEQRQMGVVVKIEEKSGLIMCRQNSRLFFNMSEVMEVKRLELNQKVDFSVIPNETVKGGNQAVRIRRTEDVFTSGAKPVGAKKEKKKLTIKLITASLTDQRKPDENKPNPPAECDELKAVVQTPRSQDNQLSDSRKDSDSSRRRPRRSKSSSPITDKFGHNICKKPRNSSRERDGRSRSTREEDGRNRSTRRERDGRSGSTRSQKPRSSSREKDGRSRSMRSRSTEKDGRSRSMRSRSTEKDRHSKSMQSRSMETSHKGSDERSRSRSRGSDGFRGRREQEGTSQRRSTDSILSPGGSRPGDTVDEELARKKRELKELNEMIACHKLMVAVEPRGEMMAVRPTEKTCIDYDHGRIAVPLTGYKSNLLKHNEDSSGLLFPTKTESSDGDQNHSNPLTLNHIQAFDSLEHRHPSYNHTSSKMSYHDEPLYEQTSAQHSSFQTPQASPPNQPPPTQHPCRQTPPSQPPPNQTPPSQFFSHQMQHKQPPAPQSPPCQPPPSKTPKENLNLTTQIARFLNTLNKGVDASLLSTAVKEAQDQLGVIAKKTQEPPQPYCKPQAGDDKSRDHPRWSEAQPERTHQGSGPDHHHDLTTTEHSQDDLLPHKTSIWDGRVLSQVVGMAQEQQSRGPYQRESSVEEDQQFHYGREAPAAAEHEKHSSGSADGHKRDGDGSSPKRETRKGSRSKSEQFDKIRSLLQTIGLNLNTADVSKLADRTQGRLYGRREELSSERSDKDRGYSSSRMEDWSRTSSSDSEHLQPNVPASLSSQEEFPAHQHETSEYEGFLDKDEEEALEQARLMQTLIKAEQATTPISPTPSTSQYSHELPGTSGAPTPYGWHQGATTHPTPLGSAAASPGHQSPVMYLPEGNPACATQEGRPSGLNLHYYKLPPMGPSPVSPYALHPLTGTAIAARSPEQVNTTHKTIHQNLNTRVTSLTPTSDTSKQSTTATTTAVSRFFKVIETVETETVQKEAPKPEAQVVLLSQPSEAPSRVFHGLQATTESKQACSGAEDNIKAMQKERLEWFNLRMIEKSKRKRMMMREKRNQMKNSARNKMHNNSPEKVISSEPKNIWICGHSLVYWAEMRAKSPEVGMQLGMDPSSVVVWWKGTQGMTWPQLLPQLLQLKIKWPNPDMVIMHLGGNDLAIDNLSDFLSSVMKDLTSMRSIFPQCLLVWSDILPRRVWRHSKDSHEVDLVRATINRRVHSIIAELGGTALTHSNISCDSDTGLYRPDGVHLSGKGIDTFNLNLQDFLVKWEMEVNGSPQQS